MAPAHAPDGEERTSVMDGAVPLREVALANAI